MKVQLASDHPVDEKTVKAATGKTLAQWFKAIDDAVGPDQGRAAVNKFLFTESKVDPWWSTTLSVEYEAHHRKLQSDGLPKGYNICATKTIAASVADAYAAWATPAALTAWFGKGVEATVKDGGTFRTADGNRGTFKRVRPGKDLRFSWDEPSQGGPSIVDVVFQDKGKGKVGVMVTHDRIQDRPAADGLRAAWGVALDALKATLERA